MPSLTKLRGEYLQTHHPIFFAWDTHWTDKLVKWNKPFFDPDTMHGVGILRQSFAPSQAAQSSVTVFLHCSHKTSLFLNTPPKGPHPFSLLFFGLNSKAQTYNYSWLCLYCTNTSWLPLWHILTHFISSKPKLFSPPISFRQCSRTTPCYSYQMCWRCSWRMDRLSPLRLIAVPLLGYVWYSCAHG